MKQGRPTISGPHDHKVEPSSRVVNPGGTDRFAVPTANHATDTGTFTPRVTPLYAGRGYEAPMAKPSSHPKGTQGKH